MTFLCREDGMACLLLQRKEFEFLIAVLAAALLLLVAKGELYLAVRGMFAGRPSPFRYMYKFKISVLHVAIHAHSIKSCP